jgi:hypothetical protein
MSKLTDFYSGEGADGEGRKLEDVWRWNNDRMEVCHDYIQWLFPLKDESNFNPDAPLITEDDVKLFHANPRLQENLFYSTAYFLTFLGLYVDQENSESDYIVQERYDFDTRLYIWNNPNHNWLRITRMLKSLMLLGQVDLAKAIYTKLKDLHENKGYASDNSFVFWTDAVNNT